MHNAIVWVGAILAGAAMSVYSETDTTTKPIYLANFTKNVGAHPLSQPILASDGNYYGTLPFQSRGDAGSIYQMTPDGSLTVIHRFKTFDGANPGGRLLQASDGALYGTTPSGGRNKGCGTIFRITLDGLFTTLHVFNCGKRGGGAPSGGLVQAKDGLLYGMTSEGGSHRDGVIYSFSLARAFSIVANLSYPLSGSKPKGELVQIDDGTFFGITSEGGTNKGGTLFSMNSLGVLTRQYAFSLADHPNSGLAYSSSTEQVFGTLGSGTIYFYRKGIVRGLVTIPYGGAMGGLTLDPNANTLYGFCSSDNGGCVYTVNFDDGTARIAGHLKGNVAGEPTFDGDGGIVGATVTGGTADDGTIFLMRP